MIYNFLLFIYLFAGCCFSLPASSSVHVNEGWDTFLGSNVTSLIQLLHSGSKMYYFGFNFKTATYFQAAQFCEDIHMKLVSIENSEENDRIYKFLRDANKGDVFWTSGSKLLDGKHWIWMSQGLPVDYTNWAAGNPDSQTEHCIAAYLNKNVGLTWTDRDCLVQMSFICEKRINTNSSQLENDIGEWKSIYENPFMSANVPLFHLNDKSYFLGRYFKATFQEAVQLCEMMQMSLVAITSQEENNRIYKYIRDTNAGDTFWTSGTRMIDGTTWVWLSTAQLVDYTNWYTGQPDSITDHCIQLYAQKDKGLFWTDSNCVLRSFYICEKPRDTILFEKNEVVATRQSFRISKEDREALVQMERKDYYLGTQLKITQFEASQYCQRHNMQLISIRTEEENEEIRQLLLHHSATTQAFWTSARRSSEKDQWTWSSGTKMKYSNLKSGDSTKEDSLCIEVFPNATWREQLCEEKRLFICEKNNEVKACSKVPPILNVYANNDAVAKNASLPYSFFKIDKATFDVLPNLPEMT